MDLISEEDLKDEVKRVLEKVLGESVNSATETKIREQIRELVKNTFDVNDAKELLKQEMDLRIAEIKQLVNDYFAWASWKTRISKCVWDYIERNWFIPTQLSEVEKEVIVSDVFGRIDQQIGAVVEWHLTNNSVVIDKLNQIFIDYKRIDELKEVVEKLKKFWYIWEATAIEYIIANSNPYSSNEILSS